MFVKTSSTVVTEQTKSLLYVDCAIYTLQRKRCVRDKYFDKSSIFREMLVTPSHFSEIFIFPFSQSISLELWVSFCRTPVTTNDGKLCVTACFSAPQYQHNVTHVGSCFYSEFLLHFHSLHKFYKSFATDRVVAGQTTGDDVLFWSPARLSLCVTMFVQISK